MRNTANAVLLAVTARVDERVCDINATVRWGDVSNTGYGGRSSTRCRR